MIMGTETSLNGASPARHETGKRNKGESLIEFPADYTVIDIETTGLSPRFNKIIELCALRVRNNAVVDKFSTLVNPECRINSFITKLTGITNEMVKDAPKIKEVLFKYLEFIGNDTVLGHNVNFDINFIFDNCVECYGKEFSNNFIDTCRISKKFCSLGSHKLNYLAEYYKIDSSGHHRAENDCFMTHLIFQAIKNEISLKYNSIKKGL